MKISYDEIKRVAELAKLEIPEEKMEQAVKDFEEITDMVEDLPDARDCENNRLDERIILREDAENIDEDKMTAEKMLGYKDGYFSVPRIMG